MNDENIRLAAEAIAQALEGGLAQSLETAASVEGVYGTREPSALAAILAGREGGEGATLFEMLFFPDAALKASLEPILSRLACSGDEAAAVGEAAAGLISETIALLPEGGSLTLALSAEEVRGFVARLRLDRNPPEAVADVLDARFGAEAAARMRAAKRHSRLAWNRPREFFLSALFRNLDGDEALALEMMDWALGYLDIIGPETLPEGALGARWNALFSQLRLADQALDLFARGNFETLMSQGVRLPHVHADSVRREMELVDLASRALLGRSAGELARAERDLGTYDDPAALLDALGGVDG